MTGQNRSTAVMQRRQDDAARGPESGKDRAAGDGPSMDDEVPF